LAVTRRVGHAVARHAVRRRLREAFRVSKGALPLGFDIVCVALAPAAEKGASLRASLIELARRASAGGRA
jgi:ribonuclease P protein component